MSGKLRRTSLTDMPELPHDFQARLRAMGITTVEILAGSLPEEISSKTDMPLNRAQDLVRSAKQTIGIGGFKTHAELEKEIKPRLGTGIGCIDDYLGGGFESGSVIELRGPQWAGKTLMCSHLAVMAQLMETNDGSIPKVVWYDAHGTYRQRRIKEIAFRMRRDPERTVQNIVLVEVLRKGVMEASLETMRRLLARSHVALVVIDSLKAALKYLETPSTLTGYVGHLGRLAQTTGVSFVITSRTPIGISRTAGREYDRSGTLSSVVNYEFILHLKGERERDILMTDFSTVSDNKCKLYIGHGGFFGNRDSRNVEARRVQRYLRRNKT